MDSVCFCYLNWFSRTQLHWITYQVSIFVHGHSKHPCSHPKTLIIIFNHLLVPLPDELPLDVILHENTHQTRPRMKVHALLHVAAWSCRCISPFHHHRICHDRSSTSPTQWGPAHRSQMQPAAGRTAAPPPTGSWLAGQRQQECYTVTFSQQYLLLVAFTFTF